MLAFAEGRHDDVVAELLPIRTILARFGGSHAQRDALQRTLVDSAIRAGQLDLARALLDERLGVRETSVWSWRRRGEVVRATGDTPSAAERADQRAAHAEPASPPPPAGTPAVSHREPGHHAFPTGNPTAHPTTVQRANRETTMPPTPTTTTGGPAGARPAPASPPSPCVVGHRRRRLDRLGSDGNRHRPRTIEVDIAEDGTRFVFDEAPVFDDGFPAYGNPFVTQGYIYPAGTLTDSNGVNPDGSPEFPDKVIGEWSCRGYFIADGAHTTEGSWVFTTQLFAFGDDADSGAETIVVTGYEGAEVGEIVTGAITGGTGRYATARGEADQELLGLNNPELATMGINKTVELELER